MTQFLEESDDYDNPWKDAITLFFPAFIEFCFPDIYSLIDWKQPPEFLDQELPKIVRDSKTGKQYVDKLVKVWQANGQETWVLIHIEVQTQRDSEFAKRIYLYNIRIFDHYDQPVLSLAILADESRTWKPNEYRREIWGCEATLKFPVVKLTEYSTEALENSNNPFAIITQAHLTTLKTKNKPKSRYQGKIKLVKRLYQQGYQKQDILELFRLIDWMLNLPKNWQNRFNEDLAKFEEEQKMPYLTSIERSALERGESKGEIQKSQEYVLEVLQIRFESVPENLINQVNAINEQDILTSLHRQAVITRSLEDFEEFLRGIIS